MIVSYNEFTDQLVLSNLVNSINEKKNIKKSLINLTNSFVIFKIKERI